MKSFDFDYRLVVTRLPRWSRFRCFTQGDFLSRSPALARVSDASKKNGRPVDNLLCWIRFSAWFL